ncbi:heme exporter protein CcmD [Microbulbifer marinus]|uniref:Heme exporter protein D n=1 Tax=Microbulbifer marinus TaxID=658218 RepID=A0A1H3VNB1_9GAMM|nr:heme exporter protein CcmD [Microbulbifer marinus]SDZ76287.1 heme exporter protein D [Microbulbifer marinus]
MQFQFAGFADFMAMEGHGIYVWISYGVTFALLASLAAFPLLRRRQLQRELQRQQRIQQRRRQAENGRKATTEPA